MPTKTWYSFYRGQLRVRRNPVTFTPMMAHTTEPLTGRRLRHDLVLHPELPRHPWHFNCHSQWVISDRESGCTVSDRPCYSPLDALRAWRHQVRRITRRDGQAIGISLAAYRNQWWSGTILLNQSCLTHLPPLGWAQSPLTFAQELAP